MEVCKLNSVFLENNLPMLQSALSAPNLLDNKVTYIAKEDNFVLTGNNFRVYMHSRYNQEREMSFLLNKIKADVETIVLFGFGNAKIINEIAIRFPALRQLIVVDPNPEPVLCYLQQRNINDIYKCFRNISFVVNKTVEEAENQLSQMIDGHNRITVLAHLTYQFIYPDYYHALWRKVYDIVRFKAVNTITAEAFREKWVVNFWQNLKYDAYDIGVFAQMCKGVPAILVSGGPSLAKNIHLLEKARSRAVLVAVGSAMTILSSHDIVPHLRVAIDPHEANRKIFAKVDTAQCPLVYSNRLFHGILPHYNAARINISLGDVDVLESYIFDKANIPRLSVRSGFSVANSALDMLIKLGCSPIIFVGQDLCYTGGRLHANGAWDENSENLQNTDRAVDIYGNSVDTSKPFLGMKDLFEFLIAGAQRTRFINATEGGLAIKGAPNKALAEVLEQDLLEKYDFTGEIERILGRQNGNFQARRHKINAVVDNVQAALAQLLERNKRMLTKLSKLERKVSQGIPKQKLLSELNLINALAKKQMMNDFFSNVVYQTFLDKIILRGNRQLDKIEDSDQLLRAEIKFLRANMVELHEYMALTDKLIAGYKTAGQN